MLEFAEIEDLPLKHLFDRGTDAGLADSKGAVRLTAGAPGPDLLRRCVPLFQSATKHCLEKEQVEANIFQYGATPGSWEFREQLAKFLTEHYHEPVNRADLVLTCGATHGLQIILASVLAPGAVIFVEEATYMIALAVFQEFPSLPLVPVKMDKDGIIITELESKARELKAVGIWEVSLEKPFWAMLYTMPVFHNPTGVTLKQERCAALVQLARELQMLVFCDDVYNLLAHRTKPKPPRRLFSMDRHEAGKFGGHVISNGSFSKILAPGVRVGWLEVPPRLAIKLRSTGLLRSSGAVNHYMSGLVTSLLELGLLRDHLSFLSSTLQARMQAVCGVLDACLPPGCTYLRPHGGYYIWLQLPILTDAEEFSAWSQEHHSVAAFPGTHFASRAGALSNCLRIAVSFHTQPVLEKSARTLCDALQLYLTRPALANSTIKTQSNCIKSMNTERTKK